MGKKSKKPWYKDGLCFECTQCGDCCTGAPGLVQFTPEEGKAMAATLEMSHQGFLDKFATKSSDGNLWELGEVETEHGHDCVLLARDDTGKSWCVAHQSRPLQCRTWPFWPDNLRSQRSWKKAAKGCEGIGRGDIVSLRVIQDECDRTPEWGRSR